MLLMLTKRWSSKLAGECGRGGCLPDLHSLVTSAGTLAATNTGAVVSRTVTTCAAVALLPQASVAVQDRVITQLYSQLPAIFTAVYLITGLRSQLSVALGLAGADTALHSLVTSAGTLAITSADVCTPRTDTTCAAAALLTQASVAVQVRVIT